MGGVYTIEETIEVEVEIDKDNLLALALEAHRRDITLNSFIIELLENYARKQESSLGETQNP